MKPAPHILMLLENNPFPQDSRVRQEALALRQAGYRVSVIAPAQTGQPWRESVAGVQVIRYPGPRPAEGVLGYLWEYGYSLLMTWVLTLGLFLRQRFDVIHAHNPPDLYVLIAAPYRLLGVRFVFDQHDLWSEMYRIRFAGGIHRLALSVVLGLERLSYRLADLVIATNQSYREVALERGELPASRVAIVRNGPDLAQMRLVEPDPALRELGKAIIGFVGQIGDHDGLDYLLRACRHLVYDLGRRDVVCLIVGDGASLPELRQLAVTLGVAEFVQFAGYRRGEDLLRLMSAMDICVAVDPKNSYNDRSTMIKLMEYMALAKPIVAFELTENRRTAQEAALYVADNDELEFARQIAALIDDPLRRQILGAVGRKRVEDELAWPYQAQHLLAAYQSICPLPNLYSTQATAWTEVQP